MALVASIQQVYEDGSINPIEVDGEQQDVIEVTAYSARSLGMALGNVLTRYPGVDCFDVTITRTED